MSSLSIVMIVKNEADSIMECLDSIKNMADEIIVLDSGSEDDTVKICKGKGAKVFKNKTPWPGFGKQRQIAQSYATQEWVFMLDADERFTTKSRSEIKEIVSKNDQTKVWQIPRLSKVFGCFIKHSGWYPDYVIRLYPRQKAQYNNNLVHEKLEVDNLKICSLKHHILHFTYKSMNDYLVKSANYAKAWADQRVKQGKTTTITSALLHGLACFLKMYIFRAGFLDGKQGLILAILSAHSTFVKYIDLWNKNENG